MLCDPQIMRKILFALVLLASARLEAAPGRPGAKGSAAKTAKAKGVEIRRPSGGVVIPARALRLKYVRSLAGEKSTIVKGLIDYRSVRLRVRELRKSLGDTMKVTPLVKTDSFILDRIDFRGKASEGSPNAPKRKILIVGGVHSGSEPVGVETALRFAESLVKDASILAHFDITIVPLVNPSGFMRTDKTVSKAGTPGRYTTAGADLNRSFAKGKWTKESKAMADLMNSEQFYAVLDCHGAGPQRDGFFAIRGGEDGGIANRFMQNADGIPLLSAKGAGTGYEFNSPGVVTSSNPGTLKHFALSTGSRYSYTFEAPNGFTAAQQVKGQLSMVQSALRGLISHGEF